MCFIGISHDMHGNVREWVEDCSNNNYVGAPIDGSAWVEGDCTGRGLRGGGADDPADYMRSASRDAMSVNSKGHGFRVARDLN